MPDDATASTVVKEATRGMIPDIVTDDTVAGSVLIAVSGLYFKGKWEVQLNDGDAPKIIKDASGWWARFKHRVKPSPLRHFFPHATPFTFRSPSVVGAMLPDFLRADPQPPSLTSSPPGGPALALSELAHLSGEFSGPGCLVRYLIGSAAPSVIRALATTLGPCQQPGKVSCALVGLHVRRGDSAMARECKTCVDQGDPDVRGSDRIETARVAASIGLSLETRPPEALTSAHGGLSNVLASRPAETQCDRSVASSNAT